MSELLRVYSRKMIIFFLILFTLNTSIFSVFVIPDPDKVRTEYENIKYVSEYDAFLERIDENSENVKILMSYGSHFDAEKTEKLINSYSELFGTHAVPGNNNGITTFINYRLSDFAVLLFLLLIAADFQKERKKGLVNLIRATVRGRGRLYFYRVFVLAFSAVVASVIIYGGCFAVVYLRDGNPEISRSIQSLPEFMNCPYSMTIGGYIAKMMAAKVITLFIISFIFYLIISLVGTGMAYAAAAAVFAAEILIYNRTGILSQFNHLRYINLFTVLKFDCYYNECYYLNISENAVRITYILILTAAVVFAAALTAGYIIHGKRYVRNTDLMEKITDRINRIAERFPVQKTLPGWELFKLYIKQGGIIFVAAAVAAAVYTSSGYRYYNQPDWDSVFMQQKMEGTITQEKLDYINERMEIWQKSKDFNTERSYDLMQKKPSDGLRMTLMNVAFALERAEDGIKICGETRENLVSALEYTERTGKTLNFIKPYAYEMLLRDDMYSVDKASLFILIGIIGSVSGIYAYDRRNNMRNSIRSSYRGRGYNALARIIPVCLICMAVCVSVHFVQFYQINSYMKLEYFDEPIQSLLIKRDFPLNITIGQYLVLLFAVRAAAAAGTALICCFISRLCPDSTTAAGICIFVLAVPSLIAQMIPDAGFVNAVSLLSGAGI